MSIFSREKKYEWINNSPFDHYFLKMQIWHQKWPMVIEKIFGIDMKYPLLMYSLGHLHFNNRRLMIQMSLYNDIVESNTENVIQAIEKNRLKVDDLIDPFKGHRAIHDAVLFDNLELVNYLIENDAHLMARDYNGVTPFLKAASLNRLNVVKALVQAGVPINHKDNKGRNAKDMARLYSHRSTLEYLNSLESTLNSEKEEYWKKKTFKQKYNLATWVLKQF